MANATDLPQFRLNGSQMLALTLIELQLAQLVAAANAIVARAEQRQAADMLMECVTSLEAAKLKWLQATQTSVLLADPREMAERIKANGFAP